MSPASSRILPNAVNARALSGSTFQGRQQLVLGRLPVAELVAEPRQFDLGVGRARLALHPALDQPEGFLRPPLLGQQHGQPAVAIGVVGIPVEALIVVGFGLSQIGLAMFELARAMVGGGEV